MKEVNGNDLPDYSPILEFYRGSAVFVTGGTGFMGKVLLEKLLRTCHDVRAIYVLIRPKKGKSINERFQDILKDPLFSRLSSENPDFSQKLLPVAGDCSQRQLGMGEADRKELLSQVNIVFHAAATVRFDEKLRLAMAINVHGTKDVLKLCKEMKNLKAVVHVSTAYCHCPRKEIDEELYPTPLDHEKFEKCLQYMDDTALETLTPTIVGKWPNTYAFTKAMAENAVHRNKEDLPLCIFRPAIVVATWKEPVSGWIDNLYGPTGVVVGAGTGVLRTLHCDEHVVADLVPVDMAVNALIVAAWNTANTNSRTDDIQIYNYVSSCQQPITWGRFMKLNMHYGFHYPSERAIWYYFFSLNKSRLIHNLCVLFLHMLPAFLVDMVALLLGKKVGLLKIYQKVNRFSDVIAYFCTQEWKFTNTNVQNLWNKLTPGDKERFLFDISSLDWENYFQLYVPGLRKYLLKEDPATLTSSRRRWRRLYWLHKCVQVVFWLVVLRAVVSLGTLAASLLLDTGGS